MMDELLQYADRGGFIVGLLSFIVAHYKGWLRWGRDYDQEVADRKDCEQALKLVNDKALAKLETMEHLHYQQPRNGAP